MEKRTPRGTLIKEYDKFVDNVRLEDLLENKTYVDMEDVFTREDWLSLVADGSFIPYDGTLGEIFIDGKLTCYALKGWCLGFYLTFDDEKVYFGHNPTENSCYREKLISMEEFKALEGHVQVAWYNR